MTTLLKKNPPAFVRWTVLLLISLAMMGNYYIYDSISPLADTLVNQLHFSQSGVSLLNAIYSFPNIFMVLIGGIIIDRIGTKKSLLLFTSIVMIGAFVTSLSGSLAVMATGRLIFGLGAESMIIAVTTSVARWFKGKELSLAFGLNLTIARLGSYLAQISPLWAAKQYQHGWQPPLLLAAGAGIMAVVCIVAYMLADNYTGRNYILQKEGSQDKIVFRQLFAFPKSFWYISLLCFVFYAAMFPFTSTFGNMFFQHAHALSSGDASFLMGIPTLTAMFFTPIFGLLADKIGYRSRLMMLGSIILLPIYLILAYRFNLVGVFHLPETIHVQFGLLSINNSVSPNELIPTIMLGLAFSLVPAILWPSVALLVDASKLGTAYGLMTMIQNIGLVCFNLLIGITNDVSHAGSANPAGYIPGMWMFSVCGILGMVFAVLLKRSANAIGAVNLDKPMKEIQ